MLGGIFPAPNRFVALSDALAGSWTVLKAERSMTKRPPIRHRRHPDLNTDMATARSVAPIRQPPSTDDAKA